MSQVQPRPIVGFFHGIDPATQNDYYTDIVHVLTEKPKVNVYHPQEKKLWVPYLCGMIRLKKLDPNEMIDKQVKMFNKFPAMLTKIDSTREEFYSNALIRKYGETKIIQVKFGNSGASNTKFQLKQVGYSYIKAGYQWPDWIKIERTQPRFAKLGRILKSEMMKEQFKTTATGRVTFEHPIGKHNDMVHGWELSLDAVMEFQQKNFGYEKRRVESQVFKSKMEEIYDDYPDAEEQEEDPIFVKYRGANILDEN